MLLKMWHNTVSPFYISPVFLIIVSPDAQSSKQTQPSHEALHERAHWNDYSLVQTIIIQCVTFTEGSSQWDEFEQETYCISFQ